MKDMQTDVNMPFVLKWDGKELDLVAKTVMRKKDFKTSNKTFAVEHAIDALLKEKKNARIPRKKDNQQTLKSIVTFTQMKILKAQFMVQSSQQ